VSRVDLTTPADPAAAVLNRCREIKRQAKALMQTLVVEDRAASTKALTTLHALNRELEALRDRYRELQAGAGSAAKPSPS